jgi:hypothetical protein
MRDKTRTIIKWADLFELVASVLDFKNAWIRIVIVEGEGRRF